MLLLSRTVGAKNNRLKYVSNNSDRTFQINLFLKALILNHTTFPGLKILAGQQLHVSIGNKEAQTLKNNHTNYVGFSAKTAYTLINRENTSLTSIKKDFNSNKHTLAKTTKEIFSAISN